MSRVLTRPTPPERYRPRGGVCDSRASQGTLARSRVNRLLGPPARKASLKASKSRAAACCAPSNCKRCAATSALQRSITVWGPITVWDRLVVRLQILVVGPRAALRGPPGNDLVRILDVAGLAVNAIRRIDLQPPSAGAVRDHLVYACGTEVLARIAVFLGAAGHADRGICHFEVNRLRLFVGVSGEEEEGNTVPRRQGAQGPMPIRGLGFLQAPETRG